MDNRDDDPMQIQAQAQLRLMWELAEGRRSGEEEGWISSDEVRNHFKTRANANKN